MKALLVVLTFLVGSSAFAKHVSCSLAAVQVVRAMQAGTSAEAASQIRASAHYGFDDNADLVYMVQTREMVGGDAEMTLNYKVIATGSRSNCRILSATRVAR